MACERRQYFRRLATAVNAFSGEPNATTSGKPNGARLRWRSMPLLLTLDSRYPRPPKSQYSSAHNPQRVIPQAQAVAASSGHHVSLTTTTTRLDIRFRDLRSSMPRASMPMLHKSINADATQAHQY
ncbi:hypothetical protein K525DRAFT_159205, partial [Schizophyllum commune Loenen D]